MFSSNETTTISSVSNVGLKSETDGDRRGDHLIHCNKWAIAFKFLTTAIALKITHFNSAECSEKNIVQDYDNIIN